MPLLEAAYVNLAIELVKKPGRYLKNYVPLINKVFAQVSPEEGGTGPDYAAEVRKKIEQMAARIEAERAPRAAENRDQGEKG